MIGKYPHYMTMSLIVVNTKKKEKKIQKQINLSFVSLEFPKSRKNDWYDFYDIRWVVKKNSRKGKAACQLKKEEQEKRKEHHCILPSKRSNNVNNLRLCCRDTFALFVCCWFIFAGLNIVNRGNNKTKSYRKNLSVQ